MGDSMTKYLEKGLDAKSINKIKYFSEGNVRFFLDLVRDHPELTNDNIIQNYANKLK